MACSGKSPEEVRQEAAMAASKGDQQKRLESLLYFHENFKEHADLPNVLFEIGFIYNNELNDLKNAKKYYELFITKFPEHAMVRDAQMELKYLGVPADDLPFFNTDSTKKTIL